MTLRVCRDAFEAMLAHARKTHPEEACGLLGGRDDLACRQIAVPNLLRSATAFQMEPQAQITAMMALEEAGEQMLALYHSHPDGPAWPSARDIAEAAYPDAAFFIVSLEDLARPQVRAFRIAADAVETLAWSVE